MPTVFLTQSLLFFVLLAILTFLGTEVSEVRHLLMRGAIFLVAAVFVFVTAALGLARGGAIGRLRAIYGGAAFLFIATLFAVQASRAVKIYPEVEQVRRWPKT